MADIIGRIEALAEKTLTHMGFEIIRVLLSGAHRQTLQVMIDRLDGENISIEDCVLVSQTLSALLDVEDPIKESYNLEVTSPGMDRPLTKWKHFAKFIGEKLRLEVKDPIDGRRRFAGILKDAKDEIIVIEWLADKGEVMTTSIPFIMVEKAKLTPFVEIQPKSTRKKLQG